jgi:hypothetical protein
LGVVCGTLGLGRFLSACGGDDSTQQDAALDQTVTCATNLTMCAASCVDLTADPAHCGACNTPCGNGQICTGGKCSQTCGGGSAKCGDACADLLGDPNDGGCSLSCQKGYQACPNDAGVNTCIDPQTNDYNCNGCGMVCGAGTRCEGGTCGVTCQAGLSVCTEQVDAADGSTSSIDRCVNLIVDPANCGACGTVCEGGTFCSPTDDAGDAACGLGCFGGSKLCNNRCVDPKIDPYNCGTCNFVCDGGSPTCVSGTCQ